MYMKILYKFLLIIGITIPILTFLSCSKFLDIVPDDVATVETAFENQQNAESFLFTCYSYLPDPSDPWTYPGYSMDEFYIHSPEDTYFDLNQEMNKIVQGFQSSNQTYLDFWGGTGGKAVKNLFQGIRDCNIFLENIHTPHDMKSESERKRWIAEAKFIKAYLHFFMLELYGPIPLMKSNIPISASPEEVRVFRDPVDSCANYIVSLLDESIVDLPNSIQDLKNEYRRITKPIALAVKAKVLATVASPLFNGGVSEYAGFTDKKGRQLISTTVDPKKWIRAVEAIKNAIDVCESNGNRLMDTTDVKSYNILTTRYKYKILLRDIVSKGGDLGLTDNPEVVWAINQGTKGPKGFYDQNTPYSGCVEHLFYAPISMWTGWGGATLNSTKLFYTEKGIPLELDKDWLGLDYTKTSVATSNEKDWLAEGEETANFNFHREPRFYADLAFDRSLVVMKENEGVAPYVLRCRSGDQYAKRNYTGYNPIKLTGYTASGIGGTYFYPANYQFPIIRMADLYLLYAEALNETMTQPDDQVFQFVDKVRKRAGLKGVVDSWKNSINPNAPFTRDGMRNIIQRERQIELMYEGQRFFDLRRWFIADKYFVEPIKGWQVFGSSPDTYYKETDLFNRAYRLRDYLWPIREQDILVNSNLIQSYGW